MANSFDEGLVAANNVIQGFVELIPLGRTIVDSVHDAQQYGEIEKYDYNQLVQKDSAFYFGGQVVGLVWNLALGKACFIKMQAAGPAMAASRYACVAKLGELVVKQKKGIDMARYFMESCRAFSYTFKLWCNQARLNKGTITRQQFDRIQNNDLVNFKMGAVIWAIPGSGGLYLAGLNMMVGTLLAQQNMSTVSGGKK